MKKSVAEVFTPRNPEVNENMYVHRERHEAVFGRALDESRHMVLLGESGNGKTWLYRKVLRGRRTYKVVNSALIGRSGSIVSAIAESFNDDFHAEKVSYVETKKAGCGLSGVLNGSLEHQASYVIARPEPLLQSLKQYNSGVGTPPIVVIENLEVVFGSKDLMGELASLILLLDDPAYAGAGLRFLLVGTPSDVIEYFRRLPNMESVSNRLVELPKVAGFNDAQVRELVRRGFVGELEIRLDDGDFLTISDHVSNVTLGVAQRVHEYCQHLAYEIKGNDWSYDSSLLEKADRAWLEEGIRSSYSVVVSYFGKGTAVSLRKEQVVFAIGQIKAHEFDAVAVDGIVRKNFADAAGVANLGVGSILRRLCQGETPLLRQNGGGKYRVSDPRYLMCIRLVMRRSGVSGKVIKLSFTLA